MPQVNVRLSDRAVERLESLARRQRIARGENVWRSTVAGEMLERALSEES